MNVLVCGGAGYIGSNMTAMLAENGHKAYVYDNLSKGHIEAVVPEAEFIYGDLADYDKLVRVIRDKKIDAVMHFAAFIEVGESVKDPLGYYNNNFCNTHNLLRAMDFMGVNKFVFSSTAATYGMPDEVPIVETLPKEPINPYGESKWAVERMCHFQSQTGRLNYAALRYFNACGAGRNSQLGEDHKPESHLIPLIIQAALGQREDIKIFGTDYNTKDGTCVRDYIHIEDLCSAHLLALEKLSTESEIVFNLGNGNGYTVREVIETVKKVSGKDFKVTETDRRAGDPAVLTADSAKAQTQLGWKPKWTNLEDIVETAWKFHSARPNGYSG
ncbi:UDP-glucose 4-epimerase GalE [Sedimentisphaera salicampi]|uniref:UDP-glucose 4-epimerase n=1 Tax=Sedimentisphaera salicampi TaxID=1941349 RepID=A0A1W6LJZ5_9BACT|nr:UDP-glucose 4-epimerase GalE [Sedimentisphaera salicampi]ARN56089.1 UDP-glucose 4-epimerase [Sedimentisphaera salicampi]OXU15821.1 UDP-glucose 4-epimerase [Sedimentisphaera salicampi]